MVKKRNKRFFVFSVLFLFAGLTYAQEVVLPLTVGWKFRKANSTDGWLPANIPATVHTDLLSNEKIPDPFLGCNNVNLGWIDETDWEYSLKFNIEKGLIDGKHIELVFEGLDTYADVFLNGTLVLKADNMFRRWTIDCNKILMSGENHIQVVFRSALKELKAKSKELSYPLPGGEWALIRKSPYHFGWDWGPRFVTAGIWKPVYIRTWKKSKIEDVQVHTASVTKEKAEINAIISLFSDENARSTISISTQSNELANVKVDLKKGENTYKIPFVIQKPKLWWCNGMGEQNLYHLDFTIKDKNQNLSKSISYGIRTLELIQEPDSIGMSFYFKLNGIPTFMKGANIIPRHSFLPSASAKDLRNLLQSAKDCGFNMLRSWGGGAYEDELFFHLCDSLGIFIWQDFMFAGSMYPGDSIFLNNVKEEIKQQVLRLRNHPSLALWCGNNEVDEAWHNWGWQQQYNISKPDSTKIWQDYLNLFQGLISNVISSYDSERPYWSSSPKNGWGRKQSMTEGDSHYWGVWWGFEPFSVYKTKIPRFMSEYGFQGFPDENTIFSFSKDGKTIPDSSELLCHQKHPVGYQTIKKYLQYDGFKPKSTEDLIYLSQVEQSIGYRMAIESHRLAKPRCMGTLYWQLNDCWPVVSWSSIDFYGKWKAVQYTVRDAYKPILLSAQIKDNRIDINAVSDYLQSCDGVLKVMLYNLKGDILKNWEKAISIKPNVSEQILSLSNEFSKTDSASNFVYAEFKSKEGALFNAFSYSCKTGNLSLVNPEISVKVNADNTLTLTCNHPAFYVQISSVAKDFKIDNNYFNMLPGKEYRVKVLEGKIDKISTKSLFGFLH